MTFDLHWTRDLGLKEKTSPHDHLNSTQYHDFAAFLGYREDVRMLTFHWKAPLQPKGFLKIVELVCVCLCVYVCCMVHSSSLSPLSSPPYTHYSWWPSWLSLLLLASLLPVQCSVKKENPPVYRSRQSIPFSHMILPRLSMVVQRIFHSAQVSTSTSSLASSLWRGVCWPCSTVSLPWSSTSSSLQTRIWKELSTCLFMWWVTIIILYRKKYCNLWIFRY